MQNILSMVLALVYDRFTYFMVSTMEIHWFREPYVNDLSMFLFIGMGCMWCSRCFFFFFPSVLITQIEVVSHHGTEHFCPISLFRVKATSMVQEYQLAEEIAKDAGKERAPSWLVYAVYCSCSHHGKTIICLVFSCWCWSQRFYVQCLDVQVTSLVLTFKSLLPLVPWWICRFVFSSCRHI